MDRFLSDEIAVIFCILTQNEADHDLKMHVLLHTAAANMSKHKPGFLGCL